MDKDYWSKLMILCSSPSLKKGHKQSNNNKNNVKSVRDVSDMVHPSTECLISPGNC